MINGTNLIITRGYLNLKKRPNVFFIKYPDDREAAIFYSLALRTAADPNDKTFS